MTISDKDRARAGNRHQCGVRYDVNGQRMNKRQISELTGRSEGYIWKCLQTEPIDHFIKRVGIVEDKK